MIAAPAAPTPQELAARAVAEQKATAEKAARDAVTAKATALLAPAQNEIVVAGQRYTLTKFLGQGDFMETWETNVPGKVVKRFHHACIQARRGDVLQLFLHEGAQNFRDLQALGIPVAKIHNLDTMESDMVLVQDRVEPFGEEKLSEQAQSVIKKCLRRCYDRNAQQRLAADMFKRNFGILNGTTVFYDFVGEQTPFDGRIKEYLATLAQGDRAIYEFLDPRPPAAPAGKK